MGVFDYGDKPSGGATLQNPDSGGELASAFEQMSFIDSETKSVSVTDSGHDEYVHLRISIPKEFAIALEITPDDDLLMKQYRDDGLLVRRP